MITVPSLGTNVIPKDLGVKHDFRCTSVLFDVWLLIMPTLRRDL